MTESLRRNSRRTTPDFIIIGSAKSGTTSLYDDISAHPDTCMPSSKEPDILHRAKTVEDANELYTRHFYSIEIGKFSGEASTYYTMLPTFTDVSGFARDVWHKDVKLIYLMRDPIKRIISHLSHDYMVGRLKHIDFDRAVRDDPRYIAWSDYAMQMRPWIAAFNLDPILFLSFENYVTNRECVMDRVFTHIGLDPKKANQPATASNTRGSQRELKFSGLGKFLRSNFYQNSVRTFLPQKTLEASKQILTRKRVPPDVILSDDTINLLTETFANQRADLAALGVGTYPGLVEHLKG